MAQGKAGTCSWAEQLEKDGLDLLAAACMQMGLRQLWSHVLAQRFTCEDKMVLCRHSTMHCGRFLCLSLKHRTWLELTLVCVSKVTPMFTVHFKQASQQLPGISWHFGPILNGSEVNGSY